MNKPNPGRAPRSRRRWSARVRHDARFVRLRQTAPHNNSWLIAELAVNALPER